MCNFEHEFAQIIEPGHNVEMMRIWTVFFFVLLMWPSDADAQTAEILLKKVTEAL